MPDGKVVPQITAPTFTIRPQSVPGNYSFGAAIGIQGVNIHETNNIHIIVKDPDGNVIQDLGDVSIPAERNEDTLPSEYQGYTFCMDIRNLFFRIEGTYILEIILNGESLDGLPIPVYIRK
jgi:hypothetical protein